MSNQPGKAREPLAFFKSLVALILVALCIWAAQWQFQRGIDRQDRNTRIESQLTLPALDISEISSEEDSDISLFEWRTVKASGSFKSEQQILLKNRYFEGVYGYEVLTRFELSDGRFIWVDRGWVKAGKDAQTAPEISSVPVESVSFVGRVRLDRSLPVGAFFALPNSGTGMITKLNVQTGFASEGFYLDLISGSESSLNPKAPAQLPELSDGPHLAYSFQWVFFAGLMVYGRILIRRGQILTRKEL
jgi:cytochrome oxidase assembly protein ShyY1